MSKEYQSSLFKFLNTLQKDLKDKKIDQKQFDFLLGLFMTTEMNKFVKQELDELLPQKENNIKEMTFLTYKKSHNKVNYAS